MPGYVYENWLSQNSCYFCYGCRLLQPPYLRDHMLVVKSARSVAAIKFSLSSHRVSCLGGAVAFSVSSGLNLGLPLSSILGGSLLTFWSHETCFYNSPPYISTCKIYALADILAQEPGPVLVGKPGRKPCPLQYSATNPMKEGACWLLIHESTKVGHDWHFFLTIMYLVFVMAYIPVTCMLFLCITPLHLV